MVNEKNKQSVAELTDQLTQYKHVFFIQYQGLNVEKVTELRRSLTAVQSEMKVFKNTLTKLALKDTYSDLLPELEPVLVGPTALIFAADDPVAPAKVLVDFKEENQSVEVKAGILETKLLKSEDVAELSKLPSKEILIGKLLMLMNSPMSGFVNVLQGNTRNFVQVLNAIREQKENVG